MDIERVREENRYYLEMLSAAYRFWLRLDQIGETAIAEAVVRIVRYRLDERRKGSGVHTLP